MSRPVLAALSALLAISAAGPALSACVEDRVELRGDFRARSRRGPDLADDRARRRVRDARCQLRIAQGALRQRKRDHQRAQTELQRAVARVARREAVATRRQTEADRAKAEALALAPDRKR